MIYSFYTCFQKCIRFGLFVFRKTYTFRKNNLKKKSMALTAGNLSVLTILTIMTVLREGVLGV